MNSRALPIGRSEGVELEFKSAAVLNQPSVIAKEAVGMLNERGGSLWIGILEDEGIATTIDPVEDAATAARALRDSLIDLIEPPPTEDELIIEVVDDVVLHVALKPMQQRRPYALLKGGARNYVIRVADRNRPMTRDEIMKHFQGSRGDPALEVVTQRFLQRKNKLADEGRERFWLRYESQSPCTIDRQDPVLETYLREAEATGNRELGWNFVVPDRKPVLSKERLSTGIEDYREVSIMRSGAIELLGEMEMLHWKGNPKEIWALTLMEYCASVARLAGKVYDNLTDLGRDSAILVDCALFSVSEWGLKPGSPRSLNYMMGNMVHYSEAKDLMWNDPLSVSMDDLVNYPDHIAFRLTRRVFEAFGLREDAIPGEYDRQEKRINWPE